MRECPKSSEIRALYPHEGKELEFQKTWDIHAWAILAISVVCETIPDTYEEINELLSAIKENSNQVHEAADVLYHLLVLLENSGIKIEEVMDELKKRQK